MTPNYRHTFSFWILVVLIGAGCGTSGSVTGDPADVVGTWNYIVSDAADALNLRQGVIQITSTNGQLMATP